MTAPDPTVRATDSQWRIRARRFRAPSMTWYASTEADRDHCVRILSSDMGMGAPRVTVERV